MKRDEALAILAAHQEPLQRLGVKSLTLFGSVARDEARPDSDVDLLVEFNQQSSWLQLNIKCRIGILPVHRLEACSTI